jgi:DNA-binding XRE family transcriptional regulator
VSKLSGEIRRARAARAAAKALKEARPELDVIVPAVPRITARKVVEDFLNPVRRNDMKARRKKLRLSQSELATVLDVDVASIYRHERGDVLPALWDYALKGVEAEAAHPNARQIVRDFRSDLDRRQDIFVDGFGARGDRLVAVRMVGALRDNARAARVKKEIQRAERKAGKAVVVDLPKPRPSGESPSE